MFRETSTRLGLGLVLPSMWVFLLILHNEIDHGSCAEMPDIRIYELNSGNLTMLENLPNSDVVLPSNHDDPDRYLILQCKAHYPIQWIYSGDGAPEFITNTSVSYESKPKMFIASAGLFSLYEHHTGTYSCRSIQSTQLSSHFHFFFTGKNLLSSKVGRTIAFSNHDPTVRIPCSVSNPTAIVTLQKLVDGLISCPINDTYTFDQKMGFTLKVSKDYQPYGVYICVAHNKEKYSFLEFMIIMEEMELEISKLEDLRPPIQTVIVKTLKKPSDRPPSDPSKMRMCKYNSCGRNAQCELNRSNQPVCKCEAHFKGDPYVRCYPECIVDTDCTKDQICFDNACENPCPGACRAPPSQLSSCSVSNHSAICTYHHCSPSPCGPFSECRLIQRGAVCSCSPGYLGRPPYCASPNSPPVPDLTTTSQLFKPEPELELFYTTTSRPAPAISSQNNYDNLYHHYFESTSTQLTYFVGTTLAPHKTKINKKPPAPAQSRPEHHIQQSHNGLLSSSKPRPGEYLLHLNKKKPPPSQSRPQYHIQPNQDNHYFVFTKTEGDLGKDNIDKEKPNIIKDHPVHPVPGSAIMSMGIQGHGQGQGQGHGQGHGSPVQDIKNLFDPNQNQNKNTQSEQQQPQQPQQPAESSRSKCWFSANCPMNEKCINSKCMNPCEPSPCGPKTVCAVKVHKPVCICAPGYIRVGQFCLTTNCKSSATCPANKSCIRNKCMDPCGGYCGKNSECFVRTHSPVCRCPAGTTGNPKVLCSPIPTEPPGPPGGDLGLPVRNFCEPNPCGPNSDCLLTKNAPYVSCICKMGKMGKPPNCQTPCVVSHGCPETLACLNSTCQDPCTGFVTGYLVACRVFQHQARYFCPQGFKVVMEKGVVQCESPLYQDANKGRLDYFNHKPPTAPAPAQTNNGPFSNTPTQGSFHFEDTVEPSTVDFGSASASDGRIDDAAASEETGRIKFYSDEDFDPSDQFKSSIEDSHENKPGIVEDEILFSLKEDLDKLRNEQNPDPNEKNSGEFKPQSTKPQIGEGSEEYYFKGKISQDKHIFDDPILPIPKIPYVVKSNKVKPSSNSNDNSTVLNSNGNDSDNSKTSINSGGNTLNDEEFDDSDEFENKR